MRQTGHASNGMWTSPKKHLKADHKTYLGGAKEARGVDKEPLGEVWCGHLTVASGLYQVPPQSFCIESLVT